MLINPQYQFYLYAGKGGQSKTVHPLFDANSSVEIERESGQQFFRRKLGNKIKFIREDYDWIMAQPFDTKFELAIARLAFLQGVPNWLRCSFSLVDCTVNEDDKSIEVQPTTMDEYTDVLAGLDREFNLIKLAPEIERIMLRKRPLIQIYNLGEPTISCFLGGMTWEQDCNEITEGIEQYHFGRETLSDDTRVISITGDVETAILGRYVGTVEQNKYTNDNGYYITAIRDELVGTIEYRHRWVLLSPDGIALFSYLQRETYVTPDPQAINEVMNDWNGNAGGRSVSMLCDPIRRLYCRYLHDVSEKGERLPIDDIVEDNRNYRYASPYNVDNTLVLVYNAVEEPTEWGKTPDGLYYTPPAAIGGQKYYPIAQTSWGIGSIWFAFNPIDQEIEKQYRKTYVLRDSYPLASVISVLLREIAPNITHEATNDYSAFLYGLSDPVAGKQFRVNLTQKTNILRGDYQVPALKAPITLQQVFDMLRDTFRCYWFIENGKLRIEHISYFLNGGSYEGEPAISHDITQMLNSRNGKSWGFATNNYTFDKADVPERYTFAWADDVTSEFEGRPIEVLSNYVEAGRSEEITVANMVSDIDYMLLAPEQINEDGFAVMATVKANAINQAPEGVAFVSATNGYTDKWTLNPECRAMNGVLSFRVWGGGSAYVVFFNEDGAEISRSALVTENDSQIDLYVPAKATTIGFYAVGTIYASISSLRVEGMRELPFVDYRADGVDFALQNGYMAFSVLQPLYWRYDMPAPRLKINGEEMDAVTVKRIKSHTVSFPAGKEGVDPQKNIRTALGVGAVSKISLSLLSNIAKTTLKYVPE